MQLESQYIRVQLQEYRGNQFIKNTSKQFRVYNATVEELMNVVRHAVEDQATPKVAVLPTPPAPVVEPAPVNFKTRLLNTIKKHEGNLTAAMTELHMGRERFYKLLAENGIPRPKAVRSISPEARAKIAATQKERWKTRDRTLSETAKKRIALSQKARWARLKGEGETETEVLDQLQPPFNLREVNMREALTQEDDDDFISPTPDRSIRAVEIRTKPLGKNIYAGV